MTVLTPEERRFGLVMLASAAVYAGGAVFFLALPGATEALSALPGAATGLPADPPAPRALWHPLAVSMMATIAVCSLLAGIDPRRNRPHALPVIVAKAASTGSALTLLAAGSASASVLAVAVVDLPILALTAWAWASAVRSVNGSWLRGGPPLA